MSPNTSTAGRPGAGPPIRVRAARRRDVPLLVRHRRAMFLALARYEAAALDAHDRVYRRWLGRRLRSKTVVGMIAVAAGRPVGSGVLWLRETQPRPGPFPLRMPYLMSIYVDPEARGRGAGEAVTRALVDWAKAHGYPRTVLHASPFGRSIYRRLGFERTWEMRLGGSTFPGREPRRPLDAVRDPPG